MKNVKSQGGITLVALVVTIVVLLILAGVTIAYAVNGGIFTKAQEAVDATNKDAVGENIVLVKADVLLLRTEVTADTPASSLQTQTKAAEIVEKYYPHDKYGAYVTTGLSIDTDWNLSGSIDVTVGGKGYTIDFAAGTVTEK